MQIPVAPGSSILTDQARKFPPNLAQSMPIPTQQTLVRWMFQNYVWPQIWERQPFEDKWDRLHQMYKVEESKQAKPRNKPEKDREDDPTILKDEPDIGDTIIFDTVDRLKNLNHFVSWKDGAPVQFNRPRFLVTPKEDEFYKPTASKLKGANALIDFNITNQNVYLKHLLGSQHFHLYGMVFAISDYQFQAEIDLDTAGQQQTVITKVGITFEPTSIRKVWLNYRLPLHEMPNQPCPFWFNVCPRFVAQQNGYDPINNPHGFANLDKLGPGQYMMGSETANWTKTLEEANGSSGGRISLTRPEFSTEARWTFCPMLPLDDAGNFDPVNGLMQRFIVEIFSANLTQGFLTPVRIQKMFYPKKLLPLYGVSHIPDLDSGAYAPSIAEILESHYEAIVKAKNQYLKNKDDINDPQTWAVSGSPALTQDLRDRRKTIEVLGPNDFGWRTVVDATHSTVGFMGMVRDAAQTTGKAVDALLGKAMGSRTTATEASNAFQAAMSGATTDINIYNNGIMCPYAERIWWFSAYFMDPDLIKKITGAYGEQLSIEDMNINIGISRDIGSTYIESIVKQQHLRYAIESATRSPHLRQDILWKAFFNELRLPEALAAVQDNGFENEVTLATNQAIETYLGRMIIISPMQDHAIAIRVKTRFLEDHDSNWNRDYAAKPSAMPGLTTAQCIAQQIGLHQQFQMMIMQQQMLQQQADLLAQQTEGAPRPAQSTPSFVGGNAANPAIAQNAGEVASFVGGRM